MPLSNADIRKLPYPLWNSAVIDGDTPNDGTPIFQFTWPTSDNDEKVVISLELSLNEYVALATSVDVGRDIAFSTDTQWIWWIWSRAFAGATGMTCEQMIDCITNDSATRAAFLQYLTENGFAQDTSVITETPTQITDTQKASSLLPTTMDCADPAQNMAVARAIVREMDETVNDIFEIIEFLTDPQEATTKVTDGIPVVSFIDNLIEFTNWLQETIPETYNAAYTQEAEDNIACAIFCHLENTCSLSLNELISIYSTFTSLNIPPVDPLDVFIQFFIDAILNIETATVAAFHLLLLNLFKFPYKILNLSGFNSLKTTMKAASTWRDYTYQDLCDDCPPQNLDSTYWMIYENFQNPSSNWTITNGTLESNGLKGVNVAGTFTATCYIDLGAAKFSICFADIRVQRSHNGASASGFINVRVFPNVPPSGTDIGSVIGVTTSEEGLSVCRASGVNLLPEDSPNNINRQSVQINCTLPNLTSDTTRGLYVREIYVWGYPSSTDETKPQKAIWVSSTPTAAEQNLTCEQVFDGQYDPYAP